MKAFTAEDRYAEIMEREHCAKETIRCSHCKNWAYNRGGILYDPCHSRCRILKRQTDCYQFCRRFTPIVK